MVNIIRHGDTVKTKVYNYFISPENNEKTWTTCANNATLYALISKYFL